MQLDHEERIRRGVLLGELLQLRRVRTAHEVIGEMEQIDGDARLEQRIADVREDLVQLGPREIERLEVLEAPRAAHATLDALPATGEAREKPLGVGARERRERLLAERGHACITPRLGVSFARRARYRSESEASAVGRSARRASA